ncbi:MAG: hypothetical protein JRH08_00750 [Deltaproteobacteria bacterium]|nr:hypothetical protein [Deltaproteobacteria bacterium]MBW2124232.1 hypothetical protein [Deltaproteobacteria bacterium]
MRAVVDQDLIIHITERGDTEIGRLPKGVGLERLRWDGSKIVDLADLDKIWVECRNGVFILHAVEVPGSQLVKMKYADRKRLTKDGDKIRLKTAAEIEAEAKEEELKAKLSKLSLDDIRVALVHLLKATNIISTTVSIPTEKLQSIAKRLEE